MLCLVGAILHNSKLERWHPIFFAPAPLPSEWDLEGRVCRHKSKAHHTEGFGTFEEAEAELRRVCDQEGWTVNTTMFEWDGEGIPATIGWFPLPGTAADH